MKDKKYTFALIGIILGLTLSAFTHAGGGGGITNPRTLTVTGTGKVTLKPDIAAINVGVHTENEDVSAALSENNTKAQAVRESLVAAGVELDDIQTVSFSVYQTQVYGPMGEVTGNKYMVDNTVYITVRDLNKLGSVLTTLVNVGANNIYGITFDVSDRSAALKEARLTALSNAKKQAEELATAAGMKVGKVFSISTSNVSSTPMYDGYGYGGGGAMAGAPAPVSSGQLVISVDAYVTYELVD